MSTLPLLHLDTLRSRSILLAFSHGVDSTALFHLLREEGILCDLALVNYRVRSRSEEELSAARELAEEHGVKIHTTHAPKWEGDFECQARKFRYRFFEELIEKEGYEVLLTAHQLDDRLEWMMMRLARGAGAVELAGMESRAPRCTPGGRKYLLIRPLLETPRFLLEKYLKERGIRYFVDPTNLEGPNERAGLRKWSQAFVRRHAEGVARSFRYLEEDRRLLRQGWTVLSRSGQLRVLELEDASYAGRAADEVLKELGYLLSRKERERISREPSIVAGRTWALERRGRRLYISPYLRGVVMEKTFKEACRRAGIPPKVRPYCYREGIDPFFLEKAGFFVTREPTEGEG